MSTTTDRVLGGTNNRYDAVFTDKKDNSTMTQMDFMKLMVAEMQNQDFTNPMDNYEMVNQMAQFSNMQQMQEMASYSKTNYAMSMVGKTVTASRFTLGGDLDTTTGPVQKVSLVDGEFLIFVGGKRYELAQIMAVQNGSDGTGGSLIDPTQYPLKVSDVESESAVVSWTVPTEDEITAKNLKYTVYYAEVQADIEDPEKPGEFIKQKFDTVESVESGIKVGDAKSDVTSLAITGLKPESEYYVNIVVTDENGGKSVYKVAKLKTEPM